MPTPSHTSPFPTPSWHYTHRLSSQSSNIAIVSNHDIYKTYPFFYRLCQAMDTKVHQHSARRIFRSVRGLTRCKIRRNNWRPCMQNKISYRYMILTRCLQHESDIKYSEVPLDSNNPKSAPDLSKVFEVKSRVFFHVASVLILSKLPQQDGSKGILRLM